MSSENASTASTEVSCACCGAPYHPATGGLHWVEFTQREVPWCGACERDFVKWVKGHTNRRWGGVKFYDMVGPPRTDDNSEDQ